MIRDLETLKGSFVKNLPEITIDDFHDWKRNPVTRHLLSHLKTAYIDSIVEIADFAPGDEKSRAQINIMRGETLALEQLLNWIPVEDNDE